MERKGFTLCIQCHIWMKVTAAAYHAVYDRVYMSTICMTWEFEADTLQFEKINKSTFSKNQRKSFLFPDNIEWLTLLPLETLVCLCWPKTKSGLNLIFCMSTAILQDEWATPPRK